NYISQGPHPPLHTNYCSENSFRTGHDGEFYAMTLLSSWQTKVSRFNSTTNSYDRLLGLNATDSIGYCPDNSFATSCLINVVDYFITQDGTFFFLDNGLVRVIDDEGKVQTLYGQRLNFGNGGLAQDARFNSIPFIDHGIGDNVIVFDFSEKMIREIVPNHPTQQVINRAGNGTWGVINTALPAATQTIGEGWQNNPSFASDPVTGIIYLACNRYYICRLHPSGYWDMVIGEPNTPSYNWFDQNNVPYSSTLLGSYPVSLNHFYNGRILTGHTSYNGATGLHNRTIIRETNLNTGYTAYIAGQNADQLPRSPHFPFDQLPCEEGPGYNCNFNLGTGVYTRASTFHTPSNSWLFFDFQNTLNLMQSNGTTGSIIYFDTLPDTIQSMLWRNDILYYCSEEGELRKRNYSNYPAYVETVLHFPGQGILCAGKRILWKNASGDKPDRLVFPFMQNGLMGVAEYWNP
ncbi:MAG TPA: hypothetical protein VKZ84_00625, partial [Bacteriovoracaceae bacterium]|nr:hypothetical protein [Bacteriovoracaceae bacterium]